MNRRSPTKYMKHVSLTLVSVTAVIFFSLAGFIRSAQAVITNGASAIDGLGQYDGTSLTDPVPVYTKSGVDSPSRLGLNEGSIPVGAVIDTVNHHLFIADSGNNRVLVYTLTSGNAVSSHIPTYVLGQSLWWTSTGATTQVGMNTPTSLTMDNARSLLFVSDSGNNRVLVFDVSSLSNGKAASYVLGQPNFTTSAAATTQAGLSTPYGLAYDATRNRLYVADSANKRVMVFSGSSLANGMSGSYVLGQSSFTTATTGTTRSTLAASPAGVAFDPNLSNVYVADTGNNRVLVFSGAALVNGMDANTVLGQSSFTSATAATTRAGLSAPNGLSFDSTNNRLFVADTTNRRVLTYSGAALSIGMNANSVIGQTGFTSSTAATTQAGLSSPRNVFFDTSSNKLFVADVGNHRFTIYGTALSYGMNASDAIGQYDDSSTDPQPVYTKGSSNDTPNKYGFSGTHGGAIDRTNHRLYVANGSYGRLLVFNLTNDNLLEDHVPDYVLGQANFYTSSTSATQNTFTAAVGQPAIDEVRNRIFVPTGNRILVFSGSSLSSGMNANHVLGQTSFTANVAATTRTGLSNVGSLAYDSVNDRLFAVDSGNRRVMVYDTSAITNGMSGSYVIGQPNFTSNSTALTQAGFFSPNGIAYDSVHHRFFVSDFDYSRVLVFSGSSLSNGMNANHVLGQTSYTATTGGALCSDGQSTPATQCQTEGVMYDPVYDRLFVQEFLGRRLLVFHTAKIRNAMDASYVLGQPDFTRNIIVYNNISTRGGTRGIYDQDNARVYSFDRNNNRVIVFDARPPAAVPVIVANSNGSALTLSVTDVHRDTTVAADTISATVTNQSGDSESVTLTETAAESGIFSASLNVAPSGAAIPNDQQLQVAAGNSYTASLSYTPLAGSNVIDTDTFTAPTAAAAAAQAASGGGGGSRGHGSITTRTTSGPSAKPNAPSTGASDDSGSQSTGADGTSFTDVPATSWFSSFVIKLSELGIISGYRDAAGNLTGSFGPANPVTRAEMLKMALLSSGQTALTSEPINASAKGSWASGYVAKAEMLHLSVFRPTVDVHASATRGEVIQTILEAFGTQLDASASTFSDVSANHLNAAAIATAQQLGIISGDTDASGMPTSTFRPNDAVNRAETAKMVVRAMEIL